MSLPIAIGPYSLAVSSGCEIYVSGCIGVETTSLKLAGAVTISQVLKFKDSPLIISTCLDGILGQTKQALDNIQNIIVALGSQLGQAVKCTVLLTSMSDVEFVDGIFAEYFPYDPPARTLFCVKSLPMGALIEIELICLAPSHSFKYRSLL